VRVCDHFAPMSMQTRNSTVFNSLTELAVYHTFRPKLAGNSIEPMSEDSLYLNVWKPAGEQEKLPVLVYIHGGSLTSGQPSWSEYNGESLARRGIVVVNFGYRLNVFGYLATGQLADESPNGTTGNYGLLDQIAALRWVQENIAAFGGDPEQVTICGESAGASSVNALCVSPLSDGLFRRAIAESSGIVAKQPYHTFRTLDAALAMGKDIMDEFGASTMDDLRAVPAEKLVNTKHINNSMTVDGYAIAEQPYLTYEKGENHEEALLNGFNVHEADLFMLFDKVTKDDYAETLRPVLGDQAEAAAKLVPPRAVDEAYHYIVDRGGDAKGSADEVYSAAWFSYSHYCWSRLLARQGKDVWEYRFTKDNGGLGSCHGGELPYAFGCLERHAWLYDESDRALSETMQSYWANFVKYGNPNGEGLPKWETTNGRRVLELGAQVAATEDPALSLYELLDAYQDSVTAK
jgi:para-nitrobenzyl esterase